MICRIGGRGQRGADWTWHEEPRVPGRGPYPGAMDLPRGPFRLVSARAAVRAAASGVVPAEPWRRNARLLVAVSLVVQFGTYCTLPLYPLLLIELSGDLNRGVALAGVGVGFSMMTSGLTAPFWGGMADRYGHRIMLMRATFFLAVLNAPIAFITDAEQGVALRAAVGILSTIVPTIMAAGGAIVPPEEAGRTMGTLHAARTGAMVVGPLLGGILASQVGLRLPFVLSGIVVLMGTLAIALLFRDRPAGHRPPKASGQQGKAGLRHLWPLWAAIFVTQYAEYLLGPVLPPYFQMLEVPAERLALLVGLTMSLGSLGTAVAAYVAPRRWPAVSDRHLTLGLLATSLLTAGLVFAANWWEVLPLRVGIGLLCGATFALAMGAAAQRVQPEQKGLVLSAMSGANLLGGAAGSFSLAAMAVLGARALLGVDALIFLLSAVAWRIWLARS